MGVVNSASLWRIQSQKPMALYVPLLQQPTYNQPVLDVRTSGDPHTFMEAVRHAVESAGHHYPLRMQTLEERAAMVLSNERTLAVASIFLASLALLMGAIGLYGLLSHSVTRRTSEIGVRIALGAGPSEVTRLVIREAMLLVGRSDGRHCVRTRSVTAVRVRTLRYVASQSCRDRSLLRGLGLGRIRRRLCTRSPCRAARSDGGVAPGIVQKKVLDRLAN